MLRDADPHHWKMGIFYYNPDNPSVFVLKRSRLGFTINFARPVVWAIHGALLAGAIYFAIVNNR